MAETLLLSGLLVCVCFVHVFGARVSEYQKIKDYQDDDVDDSPIEYQDIVPGGRTKPQKIVKENKKPIWYSPVHQKPIDESITKESPTKPASARDVIRVSKDSHPSSSTDDHSVGPIASDSKLLNQFGSHSRIHDIFSTGHPETQHKQLIPSKGPKPGGEYQVDKTIITSKQKEHQTVRFKKMSYRQRPDLCDINEIAGYCGVHCWSNFSKLQNYHKYNSDQCLRDCVMLLKEECDTNDDDEDNDNDNDNDNV